MINSHRTQGQLRCSAVLAVATGCLLACAGWSAESNPASNAVPRAAKTPPTNAPPDFRIQPGFRLELVAAEPVVTAPVAMAFDERGRLFVVERRDTPNPSGTSAHVGRIRLLEDPEGEGEFHSSTVYADNLPWVSAVACWSGGVFVAAGPELIYLKDTKTNGIADLRKAIFAGFGNTNTANASSLPNNFNWGLDNRIHAASAGIDGFVPASSAPGALPVPLNSADFSFDPRGLTICAEAGPAQSGLSFDDWGRKFTCNFLQPLRTPRYELRYVARNPFFPPPPLILDAASPATPIFRLAAVKPPVRAAVRSQAADEPAPPVAQVTNVLMATWLTNAHGCVVYRGSAFPSNYLGNVFVADPSAHVIHRFVLREAGLEVTAFRAPDEANTEFVASADTGFRPVQLVNGPAGVLYVVDRRDAGEHGRIYRIVPADFKPPKPLQLAKANASELVAALSHANGWERDTAARLLYEHRDRKAVPPLSNLLVQAHAPLARLHALHALDGLGALNQTHVLDGLRDSDARVRSQAVLLSERLSHDGALPDALWNQLRLLSADLSIRVRYQLAFTVGEIRRPDSAQVLGAILVGAPANLWMQAAVFSSLAEGAGNLLVTLGGDARVRSDPIGQDWLRQLAAVIGVKGQAADIAEVFGFVDLLRSTPQQAFPLLADLGDGLHRNRSSLALADPGAGMQMFYTEALNALQNYTIPDSWRISAMQLLGVSPQTYSDVGDVLLLQVGTGQSEAIQATALATLGRFDEPRIVPAIAQRWRALTPRLRNDALGALLARTNRVPAVLAGLANGWLGRADLSSAQVNYLRTVHDPALSNRARQLFGPVPVQRPEAVKRFRSALGFQGAAARGREIFMARCAGCHHRGGAIPAVGPDLAIVKIYGREKVLTAILEPNAGVRFDYLTYLVETAWGESLIGLLRNANSTTITLQLLNGAQVLLPRTNIQYLQAQAWSLMPEGLEAGLTPQNMADLLECVMAVAP
jgi:putative membrane-bound dehydrogenase-like protein